MRYDAHEIFRQAIAFEAASGALQDHLAGEPVNDATPASQTVSASRKDFCPQVVLEAFVIELYLKCIATIETGNTPSGHHDLWRFFKRLSADSKRRIAEHYIDVLEGTTAPAHDLERAVPVASTVDGLAVDLVPCPKAQHPQQRRCNAQHQRQRGRDVE